MKLVQNRIPPPVAKPVWRLLCSRLHEAPLDECVAVLRHISVIVPVECFGIPIATQADTLEVLAEIVDKLIAYSSPKFGRLVAARRMGSVAQLAFEIKAHPFEGSNEMAGHLEEWMEGINRGVAAYATFCRRIANIDFWAADTQELGNQPASEAPIRRAHRRR